MSSKKTSMKIEKYIAIFILLLTIANSHAQSHYDIVVDNNGGGRYKTISEAIESIPIDNTVPKTIFVKNGTYLEKVKINRDLVTLKGENRDKTIIQYNQLKKDWVANPDDKGPAVINIDGDDITLNNLTLKNTMPEVGPTAYVIYATGTRTSIKNCTILNNGANTVSLLNVDGMYYVSNCYIEGTVDFLKAMGWCHLDNCKFFQKEAISSIWHEGTSNPDKKMVVTNSYFDGVEHFSIGRHHADAQFFIINCSFSSNLVDKPIYQKQYATKPEKNKLLEYGNRYYYYNCKQEGTDYYWLNDNLQNFNSSVKVEDLNTSFTFNGKWELD